MKKSVSARLTGHLLYRERLFPGTGVIAFILFMTSSLGIAFAKPYSNTVGWLTFILGSAICLLAAILQSPEIRITAGQIKVGLAVISVSHIGRIENLAAGKLADARMSQSNKIAYFVLRPGIKKSVVFEIIDTEDPHPYWHFSTRKPEEVVRVLSELKNI